VSIRVFLADSHAERREAIRAALSLDKDMEIVGSARDGEEALQKVLVLRPDIALLAADLRGGDGFETAERLVAPGLPLESIVLSDGENPGDLRRAMRAGARECLVWPVDSEELCQMIHEVWEDHRRRRETPLAVSPPLAKIIAVTGAKGGIGKTTLSVNLAAALAVMTGEPTVLLDLCAPFGDAALLLNMTPRRTLSDLISLAPVEIDQLLLEDHLERHLCGLSLLAGLSTPLREETLSPELLERILALLQQSHRAIVLDLPSSLTETTCCALSHANEALLVTNLFDMATLANSRLWKDAMASLLIPPETVRIVVNRVSPINRLPLGEMERALGGEAFQQIPNDGKLVPASVNAGMPFVLSHPSSRVAQSVFELVRMLGTRDVILTEQPREPLTALRRSSFLPSLLRRGGGI